MQDRGYPGSEPRTWELPVEPPSGTVVTDGSEKWQRDEDLWWREGGMGGGYSWGELLHRCGSVGKVVPTPAEELAARLMNLARHLSAHPDLEPVNVGRSDLQLTGAPSAVALWAWAGTLDHRMMRAQAIKGLAYVHVHGQLAGCAEFDDVWSTVPGFFEYLESMDLMSDPESKHVDLPLSVLGDFVKQQALESKLAKEIEADEPAGDMDAFSAGVAAEVAAEADGPVA